MPCEGEMQSNYIKGIKVWVKFIYSWKYFLFFSDCFLNLELTVEIFVKTIFYN